MTKARSSTTTTTLGLRVAAAAALVVIASALAVVAQEEAPKAELPEACDFPFTYKGEVHYGCMSYSKRSFCIKREKGAKDEWIRCAEGTEGVRVDEVSGATRASPEITATTTTAATLEDQPSLVINEAMPKAKDGDLSPDWIELRNTGDRPLDARGIQVLNKDALDAEEEEEAETAHESHPVFTLECDAPIVVPPSGYLVLFSASASDGTRATKECDLRLPFTLSASKERIQIRHNGRALHELAWGKDEVPPGASFGHPSDSPNARASALDQPTPLKKNSRDLGTNAYGLNYFGGRPIADTGAGTVSNFKSNLPIAVLKSFSTKAIPNYPKVRAELWISGCESKAMYLGQGGANASKMENQSVWNVDDAICTLSDAPMFDDEIGIEVRGRSSQKFPKKQFSLELWSAEGDKRANSRQAQQEDFDYSIAGLPKNADWILNGDYIDRSLVRNPVAMQMWQGFGRWAPRQVFVELFQWKPDDQASRGDGYYYKQKHLPLSFQKDYRGIYALRESIKRSKGRMDLPKLQSANFTTRGVGLSQQLPLAAPGSRVKGAYILEFRSVEHENLFRQSAAAEESDPHILDIGQTRVYFKYPKQYIAQDKRYISNLLKRTEDILLGGSMTDEERFPALYAKYLDLDSFVDYFLHTEITKNMDGYISSTYFSVDIRDGKLVAGPPWDFDLAFGNAAGWNGYYTGYDQWVFKGPNQRKFSRLAQWYAKLLQDPLFRDKVVARWRELRQEGAPLSDAGVTATFQKQRQHLSRSVSRNLNIWPLRSTTTNDNRIPIVGHKGSWDNEVSELRKWIRQRMTWMDKEIADYSSGRALAVESLQRTTFGSSFDDSDYAAEEEAAFPLLAGIRNQLRRGFWGYGQNVWGFDDQDEGGMTTYADFNELYGNGPNANLRR